MQACSRVVPPHPGVRLRSPPLEEDHFLAAMSKNGWGPDRKHSPWEKSQDGKTGSGGGVRGRKWKEREKSFFFHAESTKEHIKH